jgi:hypothetical protein
MTQQRSPVRGFLVSVGLDPEVLVEFQYNPATLSDKRSVSYASLNAPGALMPVRQYTAGGDHTLSFTVIIDGLFAERSSRPAIARDENGGIGPELAKYRAFLYPQTPRWPESAHRADGYTGLYDDREIVFTAPPLCRFGFGDRVVDCIVTEVTVTEQLFTPELAPLRAEVQMSLVELAPRGAALPGGAP